MPSRAITQVRVKSRGFFQEKSEDRCGVHTSFTPDHREIGKNKKNLKELGYRATSVVTR